MKLNGLEKYFETVNGEIVDFTQVNKYRETPLMFAFEFNKEDKLNLSHEQLDYLIKNSDLKQVNSYGMSPLMFAFEFNKSENLKLTYEQFDYLIQHSDLKQSNNSGSSPLMFSFAFNKSENLSLKNEQWKYMIYNSDLSLIKSEILLLELKKIQSELLNDDILNKINIKENKNKSYKI